MADNAGQQEARNEGVYGKMKLCPICNKKSYYYEANASIVCDSCGFTTTNADKTKVLDQWNNLPRKPNGSMYNVPTDYKEIDNQWLRDIKL